MTVTSAQVHAAIEVVRTLSGVDTVAASALVTKAMQVINIAFTAANWTGATDVCPPFGLAGEEANAMIHHLQDMNQRGNNAIAVLQTFAQAVIKHEPGSPMASAAQDAIQMAARAAEGLPPSEDGDPAAGSTETETEDEDPPRYGG